MKPARFSYHAPVDLAETLELLGELGETAMVLAGGQSLLPLMNLRLATPTDVVDVGAIDGAEGMARIEAGPTLWIGAGVTQRAAERSPAVAGAAPLVAEALPWVAHPAIRNRGTIGGSLAHADPAAELPAVMVALEATMVVAGPQQRRRVPAGAFFDSYLQTALAPGELLVGVELAPSGPGYRWAFTEMSRRHGDFALVAVALWVRQDSGGVVESANLALAGVGPTPVSLPEAARLLVGAPLGAAPADRVADAVSSALDPPDDIHATAGYRRRVAGVLACRAIEQAARRPSDPTGGSDG